jgi:hypothetical protein
MKGNEIPTNPARAMGIFSSSDNLSVLLYEEGKRVAAPRESLASLVYLRRSEPSTNILTFGNNPQAPNP